MSRPATSRLKVNPPQGSLPVLQYCAPDQLQIDASYQRTLDAPASQALIRKIAVYWDWGLCQPLFVARRADGGLFVVDGQHRLAAARLRQDIWQLPCVVTSFESAADEAAAFVSLNQQRRPLTKLELFKAALSAGDFEASQIVVAMEDAGVALSNHGSTHLMKPGHVCNIGGIQACYRRHGVQVLTRALSYVRQAFDGQVLRYAGTLFPGIASMVAQAGDLDDDRAALMVEMIGGAAQADWVKDIQLEVAAGAPSRREASVLVFAKAWADCTEALMDEAA